jgi:hypothetical protein
MHTTYAAETLARQRLAETARKAERAWMIDTPRRPKHRFHLPRVAWHRQEIRPV